MQRDDTRVTYRQAAKADTWAVRRLFRGLHDYNAGLDPLFALSDDWERVLDEHLERVWDRGVGLVVIAWEEENPVGLIMMQGHTDSPLFRHRRWAELVAIFVDPSARSSGVADHLCAVGVEWARERGYGRVQLYVTASNDRAKRFYQRLGFRPVQEIWRMHVDAFEPGPEAALAIEDVYGHHRVSPSAHQYAIEDEAHEGHD